MSSQTYAQLLRRRYGCELRGEREVKGKGRMVTLFLRNEPPSLSDTVLERELRAATTAVVPPAPASSAEATVAPESTPPLGKVLLPPSERGSQGPAVETRDSVLSIATNSDTSSFRV